MTTDLKPAPQPKIVSVSPVFVVAPAPLDEHQLVAMLLDEFRSLNPKLPLSLRIEIASWNLIERLSPRPDYSIELNDWRDVNNDAADRRAESEWAHREESRL